MNILLWNLMLALTWAVATGMFSVANFAVGFVLGYVILWLASRVIGTSDYFLKVPRVLLFAMFYVRALFMANLRVAYDVVTPRHYMRPGVVAIPLQARTDVEITLLANLITLTPGTLSLDISPDRKVLYLHTMYIDGDDFDAVRRDIHENFERRVLEVLR